MRLDILLNGIALRQILSRRVNSNTQHHVLEYVKVFKHEFTESIFWQRFQIEKTQIIDNRPGNLWC